MTGFQGTSGQQKPAECINAARTNRNQSCDQTQFASRELGLTHCGIRDVVTITQRYWTCRSIARFGELCRFPVRFQAAELIVVQDLSGTLRVSLLRRAVHRIRLHVAKRLYPCGFVENAASAQYDRRGLTIDRRHSAVSRRIHSEQFVRMSLNVVTDSGYERTSVGSWIFLSPLASGKLSLKEPCACRLPVSCRSTITRLSRTS